MEYTTLKNGVKMPLLGFGVFQVPEGEVCEESVYNALAVGYRLIDTAAVYGNEAAVGRAIQRSGVPREELFITTKLWVQDQGSAAANKAVTASLERLGLDYLDLYLIHQPFGDVYSRRAKEQGRSFNPWSRKTDYSKNADSSRDWENCPQTYIYCNMLYTHSNSVNARTILIGR